VLVYLVVAAKPRPRQRVAAALWPDTPRDRALANLRTALWEVRRRAPVVHDDGLLSVPERVDVDYRTARQAIHDLLRGVRPLGTAEPLVTLLAADVLPDWSEEWLDADRAVYDQGRVRALEVLCVRCIEEGSLALAYVAADAAVRIDPLRESARRALIAVELAEGNDCCARRSFDQYAALLHEEFGIAPTQGWEAVRASLVPRSRAG
jgi:DNA-binding SARP family transcriptional activator